MTYDLLQLAHSWYPYICCGDAHCHPVPCAEIIESGKYYIYQGMMMLKEVAKHSLDELCHICFSENENGKQFFCLFLPQSNS